MPRLGCHSQWHLGPSYLPLSIHSAGAVAEAAEDRKRRKYLQISESHHFIPCRSWNTWPNLRGRCQFHFCNCGKNIKSYWWPAWEDIPIPENLRGNAAWQCSRLTRNHDFILWEYASHLRRPVIFYLYFSFGFIFLISIFILYLLTGSWLR